MSSHPHDTIDTPEMPTIAPDVLKQFKDSFEEMATRFAITTAAYYMDEFHDDVTKRYCSNQSHFLCIALY